MADKKQNIDKAMEDTAFEPVASTVDDAGNPTNPVLDIDEILKSEPKYEWYDIEYRGQLQAIQVLKGQVIHFLGTLDDADLLLLAPAYDSQEYETETETDDDTPRDELTFMESIERSRALKLHNEFILKTFIKGVTAENIDELPDDLKRQMLKAYDVVNGISTTNKAVPRFPRKDSE